MPIKKKGTPQLESLSSNMDYMGAVMYFWKEAPFLVKGKLLVSKLGVPDVSPIIPNLSSQLRQQMEGSVQESTTHIPFIDEVLDVVYGKSL